MKAISAYRGFRGLYEVYPECIVVTVYKDKVEFEKLFGFSVNNRDEYSIEYSFRQKIDLHLLSRPCIYSDLKARAESLTDKYL